MGLFWNRDIDTPKYLETLAWAKTNRQTSSPFDGCPCRGPYWITGGYAHRESHVHRRWADGTEPGSDGRKHPDLPIEQEWARDDARWKKIEAFLEPVS